MTERCHSVIISELVIVLLDVVAAFRSPEQGGWESGFHVIVKTDVL